MKGWKRWPDTADKMRHDAGHECGKNDGVVDPSEIQHLDAEERARHRRAEDRGEAGADAADHEPAPILVAQTEDVGEQAREGGANLRGGTLFAHRTAKRQCHDGRRELDRCDQPVDATRPLMHRRDDSLGAVALRL